MTSNQINYWNYVENSRHNKATEYEAHRSNVTTERETQRSNLAREYETSRHNRADESIRAEANEITSRYNDRYLNELERHNLASEYNESGKVGAQYESSAASERNSARAAAAQYAGVNLGYAQLSETQRYNNLITSEAHRTNLANEELKRSQNIASLAQANASNKQAQARQSLADVGKLNYELELNKWNSVGRAISEANLNKITSETSRNYAQAQRSADQTRLEEQHNKIDAGNLAVKAVEAITSQAKTLVPFLGGVK